MFVVLLGDGNDSEEGGDAFQWVHYEACDLISAVFSSYLPVSTKKMLLFSSQVFYMGFEHSIVNMTLIPFSMSLKRGRPRAQPILILRVCRR